MSVADPIEKPLDVTGLVELLRPPLLRLSRRLRQETHAEGVSSQDGMLLQRIRKSPGIGVSALADAEQTSRPTISSQMKRLEAQGLVRRDDHAEDGRRSGFTLTAAGERMLQQIRARRNDWLAQRLAKLSDAEREQLAQAAGPLLKLADITL